MYRVRGESPQGSVECLLKTSVAPTCLLVGGYLWTKPLGTWLGA